MLCKKVLRTEYVFEKSRHITLKTVFRHNMIREIIFALQQSHIQYDMRKFSFPNRIIPLWNSLPDYVVSSATLNTFKARLDRFWENQEVRYNWKADTLYTGSSSNVELMFWLLYSDRTILGVMYNGLDIKAHDLRPAIYYYYYNIINLFTYLFHNFLGFLFCSILAIQCLVFPSWRWVLFEE